MPAPFDHRSGLPGVYDRAPDHPAWARVLFREGKMSQAAELMEVQTIAERRGRRIAEATMKDGDRIEGAAATVDVAAGTVTCDPGRVYVQGDVRPVAAAVLTGVAMSGEVEIGVRLTRSVETEVENPDLVGLHPGTEGEGEPGAGREVETIAWAYAGDGEPGDFFAVYLLKDGVIIDQTPPPLLSGVVQQIATYDRDANGSYIVSGHRVTALGKTGDAQVFSISEGVANIFGFKRTRYTALRHVEPEQWDTEQVDSEAHSWTDEGGGSGAIPVNHTPIASVITVIATFEAFEESVVRGPTADTSDTLANTSVQQVLEVRQGATTFVEGTDYQVVGDNIDWGLGGDEPAPGSTYEVTYYYFDAVTPDSVTDTQVTISGAVDGEAAFVTYTWKLPRVDLLCLDEQGHTVYVKGQSARARPIPPIVPVELLPLAEIENDWTGTPTVRNTGVRAFPFTQIDRMYRKLVDALNLIGLERLRRDIDSREPVAKKGVFVDDLTSDRWRDAGEPQDAAVFNGSMQLAIDPTFYTPALAGPVTLDFTEEVLIRQESATACQLINPYQVFDPLPAELVLDPPDDFWVETQTQFTSDATRVFGFGNDRRTTVRDVLVNEEEELLDFLRQIDVDFTIRGFGPGEALDALEFDNVDVTPAGLSADANGDLSGTFTIPPNVTAGTKAVVARGAGGSQATADFVGQGTVQIEVVQRVTTVRRFRRDRGNGGGGGGGGGDPLAQTFMLTEGRHIAGVDVRFCAIGDAAKDVVVDLVRVEHGIPTRDVITQARVEMTGVTLDAWHQVRFPIPVYLPAGLEFAFVFRTDDGQHALSIARMGDFDAVAQEWVGAQPYSVGVLLSSSNARTWTPHQSEDLTFRVVAARFGPTTRTVALGTHSLVNASDLLARAPAELPTGVARVTFEVERPTGEVIRLDPDQVFEFTDYETEDVELRAVLTGTETVSPVLYPRPLFVAGEMRGSGTYVTRAMTLGTGIRLSVFVKTMLPAGSTLTVEVDAADDNWTPLTLQTTTPLAEPGWNEQEYRVDPYTAQTGRLRLTLTGTPGARPSLADLRAVAI